MRKMFVRLFQVVFLLQLSTFGGQLHAHPDTDSTHSSHINLLDKFQPHILVSQGKPDEKITLQPAPSGFMISEGFENIDEKDFELEISKKSLISKDYFTSGFHIHSATNLSHNDENHLAFSRQSSFIPANRRHLILQVFRI